MSEQAQEFPTLLDMKQAASLLCCSISTMRRLILNRQIPFYRVGHSIRFSKEELARYLTFRHESVKK